VPESHDAYWSTVRSARLRLADQVVALDSADWDAPSWCEGWRVRDALGHLVYLAEASNLSMSKDLLRHGFLPNTVLDRTARLVGSEAVPDLCDRLRAAADGRFRAPGGPRPLVLGEVVAHGSDMLRPLGQSVDVRTEDLIPILNVYSRLGRTVFGSGSTGQVRLVATDSDWTNGANAKPDVRGLSVDLLLLMANRRQVMSQLSGPGLEHLS
jgi:uncharacterized protein (TIGR03083 family)